jgi:hypothetical protein
LLAANNFPIDSFAGANNFSIDPFAGANNFPIDSFASRKQNLAQPFACAPFRAIIGAFPAQRLPEPHP